MENVTAYENEMNYSSNKSKKTNVLKHNSMKIVNAKFSNRWKRITEEFPFYEIMVILLIISRRNNLPEAWLLYRT